MEACEDVYACGDIVRFPLPLVGSTASIGHWQIAHNHGNDNLLENVSHLKQVELLL